MVVFTIVDPQLAKVLIMNGRNANKGWCSHGDRYCCYLPPLQCEELFNILLQSNFLLYIFVVETNSEIRDLCSNINA